MACSERRPRCNRPIFLGEMGTAPRDAWSEPELCVLLGLECMPILALEKRSRGAWICISCHTRTPEATTSTMQERKQHCAIEQLNGGNSKRVWQLETHASSRSEHRVWRPAGCSGGKQSLPDAHATPCFPGNWHSVQIFAISQSDLLSED